MKTHYKKILIMLIPVLMAGVNLRAQTNYITAPGAEFTVSGTSSLHDWTMTSESVKGEAVINIEDNALKSISELSISIKTETLKSGKSRMDDNAYKALRSKKNPLISFSLNKIKSIANNGDHYMVEAEGVLTIAGATRTINIQSKAYPLDDELYLTGKQTFNMTDFKIDPPTALLGTIKTGDQITINYNITFKN